MWPSSLNVPIVFYYKPTNAPTCPILLGGVIFTMASTFLFTGRIPFHVTQKPRYSIWVCPKNYFSILHLRLFSLIFFRNISSLFKWLDQSPLVIINISLIYAQINSNPRNISFIFSWKISGKLHMPIGSLLYLYFPHGRIIVQKLLDWYLRRIQ